MNNQLIITIARSLYFSDANIMFGWQGWAYKQATEWRKLHDLWDTMSENEKTKWINKAKIILSDIKSTQTDLYELLVNNQMDDGFRWWA